MSGVYKTDEVEKLAAAIFEAAGFRKDYAARVADDRLRGLLQEGHDNKCRC